jgi:hypothetical protein
MFFLIKCDMIDPYLTGFGSSVCRQPDYWTMNRARTTAPPLLVRLLGSCLNGSGVPCEQCG